MLTKFSFAEGKYGRLMFKEKETALCNIATTETGSPYHYLVTAACVLQKKEIQLIWKKLSESFFGQWSLA